MNVFAGNITPDNEYLIEDMLETVAFEALPGYDLEHDVIDVEATFNISKGCGLAPAEYRFSYTEDGIIVDLVAKAINVSEGTEEGYVDISDYQLRRDQKLRYVIERSHA